MVSRDNPCARATTQCMLGLSAHTAVVCDFTFPGADLPRLDLTGHKCDFARAEEQQLHAARSLVSASLWWGYAAGLGLDRLVQLVWDALRWCIPHNTRTPVTTRHASGVAAEALEGGGALQPAADVEEWWAAWEVAAAASLLRLDQRQL